MYLIVFFSMSSLRATMLKGNTIFGYRLKDLPNDRSNLERITDQVLQQS